MRPCYLVDSSIYIFRYYFSNRPEHLSRSGRNVSTALAFGEWLIRFLIKERPKQIAMCFDESLGTCFRNEIDATYKCNRSLPDEALAYELLACKKLAELLGLPVYASTEFEADDLIATLAKYTLSTGNQVFILSRDKDLGQVLVDDSVMLWDYGYDDPIGRDSFKNEFGIEPDRMAEYLAIAGDTSDSIKGLDRVGKKTVRALFELVGDWETIKKEPAVIADCPLRGAKTLANKIQAGIELIDKNLLLTTLRDDCFQDRDILLEKRAPHWSELESLFNEFQASERQIRLLEKLRYENNC